MAVGLSSTEIKSFLVWLLRESARGEEWLVRRVRAARFGHSQPADSPCRRKL